MSNDSPDICIGIGIGLIFATGLFAVLGAKKAQQQNTIGKKALCYAPAVASGLTAAALITFGEKVKHKQYVDAVTGFATSAALARQTIADIQSAERTIVGPKKAQQIQDEAIIARAQEEEAILSREKHYDINTGVPIIDTGTGATLFRDNLSKQYFRSNLEHVMDNLDKFNTQLERLGFADLNDWINVMLDGKGEAMIIGDTLFWNHDECGDLELVRTYYKPKWANGDVCTIIQPVIKPSGRMIY